MTKTEVRLQSLEMGDRFYMTKRSRVEYLYLGMHKDEFLDMSGPSFYWKIQYRRLDGKEPVRTTFDPQMKGWVE